VSPQVCLLLQLSCAERLEALLLRLWVKESLPRLLDWRKPSERSLVVHLLPVCVNPVKDQLLESREELLEEDTVKLFLWMRCV
jgi:hypothetical protein